MKTNYKQSQAAPHAKPIFTVSRNDSTLYVLPAYLAGAVMIRLQHIADGDKVKKLCCKVKNDRLMAMEQDVPQGNVTLTAVDIISPEKCAEKGYRKDGYGYVRTLLVTPTAEHRAMFSITCTLGERDAEGHICSCGEYYHIEQILTYHCMGFPASVWADKQLELESALNMLIASVKEGNDRRTVSLCCVPPEHVFDTIEWHERYILRNEDNKLILGRGLTGDVIIDIDKTPHILIGGNTGSGKSVLVQCLLWQAIQQADVVYVADFKGGVDFSYVWQEFAYIITEETKLLVLLNHLADTLEERKRLFKKVDAANIIEYREKSGDYMQRIVFACDEVAELLDKTGADKARKELLAQIEARLALIARQGRAFGIHLILATQRPDANILPGQIKNNMNIRICGRADTTLSTIIIGDGRAAEQIPHDAQGRFIMEDGTVFQAYYFNDDTISKW